MSGRTEFGSPSADPADQDSTSALSESGYHRGVKQKTRLFNNAETWRNRDRREKVILTIIMVIVVISFVAGSILGEDSIGGARLDFYAFHWILIERFSTVPWATAISKDYIVANNPLLYCVSSLLPFRGDPRAYHLVTFVLALLGWPLLSWAYHRRYSKFGIDWLWASFGAIAILMSPGYRSSAIWGTTDYLPLLFCAGTSLLLSRFQDDQLGKAPPVSPLTLIALAVVSTCAFYTRQLYAFLPIFAAWMVLSRTKTSPLLVAIVFAAGMLPEIYLVSVWKGVNAPTNQFDFQPGFANIVIVGANIGFLAIPLILGCSRRSLGDVLPRWWGPRCTAITILGLIIFIIVGGASDWHGRGGGIIQKLSLKLGAVGPFFIAIMAYLGLSLTVLFARTSVSNTLLATLFIVPYFVPRDFYQHYLEPSLVVSLFLFADTQTARAMFNKRVLTFNAIFCSLVLATGIIYYDFVLHVTTLPLPLPTGK